MAKIIIDAFGGDYAPLEVLKGCKRAVAELGVEIILTGNKKNITRCAVNNSINLNCMEISYINDAVLDIYNETKKIINQNKNTSIDLGMKLLADGKGDAFISAGNTGHLVMSAISIVKRIKGIQRVAPAPILPTDDSYFILLDAGANVECRPEMLLQFAIMGSAYMEKVMGVKSPKVGLLNIGAEDTKGRDLDIKSYKLLQRSALNFVGNIEARDFPNGNCQVVVTDGFTGNIVLKLYEGLGLFFSNKIKWLYSGIGSVGALFASRKIKLLKKQMDYREIGGSTLLGVRKPVIKAHGSSDSRAFFNAIRQAKKCVEENITDTIEKYVVKVYEKEKFNA